MFDWTTRANNDVGNWSTITSLANYNYHTSINGVKSRLSSPVEILSAKIFPPIKIKLAPSRQGLPKSRLRPPVRILSGEIFPPIEIKLAPSHRLSRIIHSKYIERPLDIRDRYEIPVHSIDRVLITNPPPVYFVDSNIGFFFNNMGGNVYLEILSSTISQSFTIQAEKLIANEWPLLDIIYNVSNADTKYFIGPFPEDIYNQPNSDNVFVDHAVNAILNFRAWRIT
jgi:hypothetical protein